MLWYKIFRSIKPVLQDKINRQRAWLDTKKHGLADFLQMKSEQLSVAQKKTCLILFLFFGTTFCGYIIFMGFVGKGRTKLDLPNGRIHNGTVLRMGESMEGVRTQTALRNLIRFKKYMDSLKVTPGGQRKYDSLTAGRPGMMDSIQYIISNH